MKLSHSTCCGLAQLILSLLRPHICRWLLYPILPGLSPGLALRFSNGSCNVAAKSSKIFYWIPCQPWILYMLSDASAQSGMFPYTKPHLMWPTPGPAACMCQLLLQLGPSYPDPVLANILASSDASFSGLACCQPWHFHFHPVRHPHQSQILKDPKWVIRDSNWDPCACKAKTLATSLSCQGPTCEQYSGEKR